MTEEMLYSIWLQKGVGEGADTGTVLSVFGSAKEIYEQTESELRLSGAFLPGQLKRLMSTRIESAYATIERCESLGYEIITYDDKRYPELLRHISNPPLVLYVKGDVSCLSSELCIAVVGSRSASKYSLRVAHTISADMARAGAVVVSGGALGVDSAAHDGALDANGKTVAVLGCGINVPYLRANADLRRRIALTGALISEFSPDTQAEPKNFPLRNRIISGLSRGVLVIEANEKSGSLITARCALGQGRDVFAVPGDITSIDYKGVNKLIREGAKPVFGYRDVLSEYMWIYDLPEESSIDEKEDRLMKSVKSEESVKNESRTTKASDDTPKVKRPITDDVSDTAVKVYEVFSDKPLYTDEIVILTNLEPNSVFTALTELEIYGYIKMISGKRYIIV